MFIYCERQMEGLVSDNESVCHFFLSRGDRGKKSHGAISDLQRFSEAFPRRPGFFAALSFGARKQRGDAENASECCGQGPFIIVKYLPEWIFSSLSICSHTRARAHIHTLTGMSLLLITSNAFCSPNLDVSFIFVLQN